MAKVYYKATRTDGTDFYSGTVDYAAALASGERVKVPGGHGVARQGKPYVCCTADVLHASDVPGETLIGGSWPCRLFEVTGRPVAGEGHKRGFRSLRVVREIPAHEVFGPQGEHVAALIEREASLTADEARSLVRSESAAGYAAWGAAGSAARYAARYAGWYAAWYAARSAAGSAAGYAAGYAAWGAAGGLLVRDVIAAEHYDTLTLPWRTVIGRIHPDDAEMSA